MNKYTKYNLKFFSGQIKCPLGCKYCFPSIQGYQKLQTFNCEEHTESDEVITIYYPTCDTEFNWTPEFDQFIQKLFTSNSKSIVSISTKARLRPSIVEKIRVANDILISEGKGFIKLSVSITNKSQIDNIEPRTASYQERLKVLEFLSSNDIPTSVILKPILPFISVNEYKEIIEDTSCFTDFYVIGGLYFDKNSLFYTNYLENKFTISTKHAEWLPYKPLWPYIDSKETINKLTAYISAIGKKVFNSDKEMLAYVWENSLVATEYKLSL